MIQGYAENGHGEEALKLFVKMRGNGIDPDEVMFVCVLKACANIRALEQGNLVHIEALKQNIELSVFIGSILVVMYTKCGSVADARRVFDRLPTRNVVLWSSMLEAYAEQGPGEEALDLFGSMHEQGVEPNRITFLCVIKACSSISALDRGMRIHACVLEHSFESDALISNILVDMYAKCGSVCDAVSLFEVLDCASLESLSALISGYANHGQLKMAKRYFQKVWDEGIEVDIIMFLSLIYACSHSGLLQEGCFYFRCMVEEFGLIPTMEHYACAIDMLGRAGLVSEAEDVICRMPFAPDPVVWKALLSSCVRHRDLDAGMRAFRALLKFDSEHAAGYVLMSNAHAAAAFLSEDV
jgi:pentatricopeptide repeat protein